MPRFEQLAEIDSHGIAFQQQYGVQIQVNNPGHDPGSQPITQRKLPLVRELNDPIRIGVHPAVNQNGSRIPQYVTRDADGVLERSLVDGSFVLIVGDSTSGKSRTAYETIRKHFPDYRVFIPATSEELLESWTYLPEIDKCIIWLDDLEVFLGANGLNIQILDRVRGDNSILLATIRAEEYSNLSPLATAKRGHDDTHRRVVNRILEQANIVHLPRRWSEGELNRAGASPDGRVLEALAHANLYGIAEYLATGPQLFAEWLAAWAPGTHPRGAALVAVAVDFRRAGYYRPVSIEVLNDLHAHYLNERGGEILRPETLADALDWARTPLHATSSLLLPAIEERFFAFDYLVDALQRMPDAPPIPDAVWARALEISPKYTLSSIGLTAEWMKRDDIAKQAFETLAQLGDAHGAFHVGLNFLNHGELDKAEKWFKEAADGGDASGMYYLGKVLIDKNQLDKAEEMFKQSIEASDADSMKTLAHGDLGILAAKLEKWSEAEELLRRALEESTGLDLSPSVVGVLPSDVEERTRQKNKETVWNLKLALASVLQKTGKTQEAEKLLIETAGEGDSRAANDLGSFLERKGRRSDAIKWYSRSAAAGDIRATVNLGRSFALSGQLEKAKLWFRKAADAGSSDAAVMLGRAFLEQRNRKDAISWFKRANDADNAKGTFGLGSIYEKEGQFEKAAALYRRASDLGYNHALAHLGAIQETNGQIDDAESLYRSVVESESDPYGLIRLGDLILRRRSALEEAGTLTPEVDHELTREVEQYYRLAEEKGDRQAASRLNALRDDSGHTEGNEENQNTLGLTKKTPQRRRRGKRR